MQATGINSEKTIEQYNWAFFPTAIFEYFKYEIGHKKSICIS